MRHAFRRLLASPGFTLTALITLALGIGANSTAFSVLNRLLMHEVPYPEPGQLVRVYRTAPQSQAWPHSPANFLDHRAQNSVFTSMAAVQWVNFNLGEPGQPADRLRAQLVTGDFFALLGIPAALGRTFTAEDDQPGRNQVVVLSHSAWLQRFGGTPDIVGRQVRLNGENSTVIGVMPATFDDYTLWGEIGVWRPMAFSDQARQDRTNNYLNVIARLKPGVSLSDAQAAMSGLAAQFAKAYPANNSEQGLRLVPLSASIQDDAGRRITLLVMGLAGFVLLIACANLANLQFARNAARGREYAIRAALGASRARLIWDVLIESLLLSLLGGALGLLLALWSNDLVAQGFVWGDRTLDIPLDLRVVAFTFAASLATGIGFGLLPAWIASRANVGDALKQGGRGTTAGRSHNRVRHALIVGEVALALILLAGAGFFYRGLQQYTTRDPGWKIDGLVTGYINLRGERFTDATARNALFDQLHERLAAIPGVEHAAFGSSLPTWGFASSSSFVVEGQAAPAPGREPFGTSAQITPGYFEALGVRLVEGRDFTADDRRNAPAVTIVNEAMARALWPGESAVGKRIGGASPFMSNPRTIIGVVSDVRAAAALGESETRFQTYRPLAQVRPFDTVALALRSNLPAETLAREVRRVLAAIDSDQAVYQVGTVRSAIGRSLASIDVAAYAMVAFALLGMLLAAVGIYGVIAHSVTQRTNEIGLRLALGAQLRDVLMLVLGGSLRLTGVGVVLGLAGSYGIVQLLRAISPEFAAAADPLFAAGVTAFLVLVAAFAAWLPARRATKVDPMTALRAE